VGFRTHADLISDALNLAGNTGLTSQAQRWLIDVLESLYSTRHWPFLMKSMVYTLSQGVGTVNLSGVGQPLNGRKLYDVVRAELFFNGQFLRELEIVSPAISPAYRDPAAQTMPPQGLPLQVIFDMTDATNSSMRVYPPPDKNYGLNLVTLSVPTAELSYDPLRIPIYPNDRTIIQGLVAEALRHQADERQYQEAQIFEKMAADDVAKYAASSGYNLKWTLDKRVYGQPAPRYIAPWGWMGPQ